MPEYRISEGLDIFDRNVIAAINESQCLRAEDQELRCAQAGAVIHVLLNEIRRIRTSGSAGAGELNGVTDDFVRHRHFADETLEFDKLRSADGFLELNLTKRSRLAHNLNLLIFREIINDDVEHEPVELGFRQWICTLELDGVLRRQNVKWFLQNVSIAFDGDRSFLHGFEQRGLGLRRSTVDFIGENDVCENRSLHKNPRPLSGSAVFFDDFSTCAIRWHQVTRELNAREIEMQN